MKIINSLKAFSTHISNETNQNLRNADQLLSQKLETLTQFIFEIQGLQRVFPTVVKKNTINSVEYFKKKPLPFNVKLYVQAMIFTHSLMLALFVRERTFSKVFKVWFLYQATLTTISLFLRVITAALFWKKKFRYYQYLCSEKRESRLKNPTENQELTPLKEFWKYHVLKRLSYKDLICLSKTCKFFFLLIQNDSKCMNKIFKMRLSSTPLPKICEYFSKREELNFPLSLTRFDFHYQMNDEITRKIVKVCPALTKINISQMEESSFQILVKSPLPIKSLGVFMCEKFSDRSIEALATSTFPIKYLDLQNCKQLTNKSLTALTNSNLPIQVLNLGDCEQITDEGIKILARSKLPLIQIDFRGANKLTDESVKYLQTSELPLRKFYIAKWVEKISPAPLQ